VFSSTSLLFIVVVIMPGKRGLSVEEKRHRLLEIFYESKDFFLLKELEKLGPKKGVISQSVKEIVQSLVDDNLVDSDKIGTSVYFWAFPSKASASKKKRLQDAQARINAANKRIKAAEEKVAALTEGREETEERALALKEMIGLKARREELQAEARRFSDCDPEVLATLTSEAKVGVEGANRWTDNIFSLHSWIDKKFPNVSVQQLNKQFDIPEDLDYLTNKEAGK